MIHPLRDFEARCLNPDVIFSLISENKRVPWRVIR